jgi:hypothetical protein
MSRIWNRLKALNRYGDCAQGLIPIQEFAEFL